ncbi:MAG: hypothetical protein J4428_02795 [Candidatus Aenigmarchaeota archaeon]|nr:hypothetical protein [Candidatus Aenigmarchaeota archaeon]
MKVDFILKIGGSLTKERSLKELCKVITKFSKKYKIVIIPGGGKNAEYIRYLYKKFKLTDESAHNMAILAMDQYGYFLSNLMNVNLSSDINKIKFDKKPVVLLPFRHMINKNPLENSWDVTSDSIAAYFCYKLKAKNLILVKNVDGIYHSNPEKNRKVKLIRNVSATFLIKLRKKTCIDSYLPRIIQKRKINCFIVNGKYPNRLSKILQNKETVYTKLVFE